METTTAGPPARAWHERPAARWGALFVLLVGLVLVGVGVAAFVSASGTDDDADTTEARTAQVEDQADDLRAERDDALAAAEDALDEAGRLDQASSDVRDAADDLDRIYGEGTTASNAMVACGDLPEEAQFLQCLSDALGDFQATTTELEAATDTLRQALSDLEEGLQ